MADRVYPAYATDHPVAKAPPSWAYDKLQHQVPPNGASYTAPLPLPATHPSNRRGRHRSPLCCCFTFILGTLATVVILLGIASFITYLVLQPRAPKFSVQDVTISSFNVTSQSDNSVSDATYLLNSDIVFTIDARNPNKKIGLRYDTVQVTLFYDDVQIGQGSIPAFYQGHKNTTVLNLDIEGRNVPLPQSVGSTLSNAKSDGSSISLEIRTVTHVKVKAGGWKSRSMKMRVKCEVEISNLTVGSARLLSRKCKVKL